MLKELFRGEEFLEVVALFDMQVRVLARARPCNIDGNSVINHVVKRFVIIAFGVYDSASKVARDPDLPQRGQEEFC